MLALSSIVAGAAMEVAAVTLASAYIGTAFL